MLKKSTQKLPCQKNAHRIVQYAQPEEKILSDKKISKTY